MNSSKSLRGPCFALFGTVVLNACGGGGGTTATDPIGQAPTLKRTPESALQLKAAASCTALSNYLADTFSSRYLGLYGSIQTLEFASVAGDPVSPDPFVDFTDTNNQDSGVDEIDLIETDPRGHFYIVAKDRLVVANGSPDNLFEIASVDLATGGSLSGITYDVPNKRLVVLINHYYGGPLDTGITAPGATVLPQQPFEPDTETVFIDMVDPTLPAVIDRIRFDGYMMMTRQIDGRVHIVSSSQPAEPQELLTNSEFQNSLSEYYIATAAGADTSQLEQTIRNAVSAAVAAHHPLEFLPQTVQIAVDGTETPLNLLDCDDVSMPDAVVSPGFVSVLSIDTDGGNPATMSVTNLGWQAYTSQNNIYLAESSGSWFWDAPQSQQAVIHKLAIGAGQPEYRGAGVVDGWVNSGFNFNEHNGYLRLATHLNQTDPGTGESTIHNNLYVLQDNGNGSLSVAGAVTGFGPDERIFAVRFVGDRGYVVTFRQIDPLFAFDLSQPNNPRLLGEVEIPGVSTYLHPIDENHILTIGRAGTDAGLNNQLQLQIFNVANAGDPVQLHSFEPTIGNNDSAWSAAEYDNLSFTYHAGSGTLSVPLRIWSGQVDGGFSGFLVLNVDVASGFTELGRVDHGAIAYQRFCQDGSSDAEDYCQLGYFQDTAQPLRSVLADSGTGLVLYSLTTVALESRALADLTVTLDSLLLL